MLSGTCMAQDVAKAPVDRTDPQAVATAYLEAAQAADVDAALALVAMDDTLREGLRAMATGMVREEGPDGADFATMLTEVSLIPVGGRKAEMQLTGEVKDAEATSR